MRNIHGFTLGNAKHMPGPQGLAIPIDLYVYVYVICPRKESPPIAPLVTQGTYSVVYTNAALSAKYYAWE